MLTPKLSNKVKHYSNIVCSDVHFHQKVKGNSGAEAITRIVLVRDKSDEFTWSFCTNIIMSDAYDYVFLYKKRWRIETNFRVEDEAKIKSKSIFPVIRYFYFTLGLLLHSIWLVFRKEIPFKAFLVQTYKWIMLEGLKINQIDSC